MHVETCLICDGGRPANVLCDLAGAWVTGAGHAPLPGYLCVVAKRHVREPYELPPDEAMAFWLTALGVAESLATALRPKKMNDEIHGNTIPHLHMHIYPRFEGDPFEGRPIDGRASLFERTPEDLAALARAVAGVGP